MLIIAGHIHVDPADGAQFLADLKELAVAARKRPGNSAYDVAMEDPQAGRLLLSERWTDQAALSAHLDAAETLRSSTVGRYGCRAMSASSTLRTNADLWTVKPCFCCHPGARPISW
jgi:quinol monooxygenase YgiN